MTPDELTTLRAELREMLAKATPGPWSHDPSRLWGCVQGPTHTGIVATASRAGDDDGRSADAALIAAMRNALPALLDALDAADEAHDTVERLTEHVEKLRSDRDKLRAEVVELRRKPMPPTDEEPLDPLSVVRALAGPAFRDELSDEERAACATVAAEVEVLREVERYAREQDGEAEMLRSLARLDALRKEKP